MRDPPGLQTGSRLPAAARRQLVPRPSAASLRRPAVLPLLLQAHNEGPMIVTEKKELRLPTPKYCESIHQTRRRPTRTVDVRGGGAALGAGRCGAWCCAD